MEIAQLLKRIGRIRPGGQPPSEHLVAGAYRSRFKGKGTTFDQLRRYQYGDDPRAIDWNVTARYKEPFVKIFNEEREQVLVLLVDVSASGDFGTVRQTKRELMVEIGALLAFAAVRNHDRVGAVLFSDRVEKFIPPERGSPHALLLVRAMLEYQPTSPRTNIREALRFVVNVLRKRSLVVVLSDFIDQDYRGAARIAARKHHVTAIRVTDPREASMPSVGWLPIKVSETGQVKWLNTLSERARLAYGRESAARQLYFEETFGPIKAGCLQITTQEDYTGKLLSYLQNR